MCLQQVCPPPSSGNAVIATTGSSRSNRDDEISLTFDPVVPEKLALSTVCHNGCTAVIVRRSCISGDGDNGGRRHIKLRYILFQSFSSESPASEAGNFCHQNSPLAVTRLNTALLARKTLHLPQPQKFNKIR